MAQQIYPKSLILHTTGWKLPLPPCSHKLLSLGVHTPALSIQLALCWLVGTTIITQRLIVVFEMNGSRSLHFTFGGAWKKKIYSQYSTRTILKSWRRCSLTSVIAYHHDEPVWCDLSHTTTNQRSMETEISQGRSFAVPLQLSRVGLTSMIFVP